MIGLSIMTGSHIPLCQAFVAKLPEYGMQDIKWLAGGNIPVKDHQAIKDMGASAVFAVGTNLEDIVNYINEAVSS